MAEILDTFGRHSGLTLNRGKNKAYFNAHCPGKEELANVLDVDRGELPVKYLGIPLSVNCARDHEYQGLVEYAQKRVEGWNLSFGRHIELVRSVITSIARYWLHAILPPTAATVRIERICASFV